MGEDFSISVGAKLDESSFQTMQEKIKSLEKEPIRITIGKDIETQIASLKKTLESINININGGKGFDVSDLINYNSNALRSQAKKVGQEYGTIVGESVQEAINNVTTKGVGKSRYRDIGVFNSDTATRITRSVSENFEDEIAKLVNTWSNKSGRNIKSEILARTRWDSDIKENVAELDKILVTYETNLDEVIQKTITWSKVGEEGSGKNKKNIYGWVETSTKYSKSLGETTAEAEKFADSQAKIAARLKNTLESIKSSVSDKNTSKPITEQGHLKELEAQYEKIETAIGNVQTADKSTATQMKINAESLINTLQNTVKEYRNAENVSTNLKGIDVTSAKSIAENNLEKFKSDAKDVSTQMKKTLGELNSAFNNIVDASSLNTFNDKLRVARSELEKIKAETTASNRSEKVSYKATGLTTEIENFKKLNPEIENFKTKVNDAEISVQGLLDELSKVTTQGELSVISSKFDTFVKAAKNAGVLSSNTLSKVKSDAASLIKQLDSFSLKNEGFANFSTQIGENTVSLTSLKDALNSVESVDGLDKLRQQAETLKTTFIDTKTQITETFEKINSLKVNLIDVFGKLLNTDLSKSETLRKLESQFKNIYAEYEKYGKKYLGDESSPDYIGDKLSTEQITKWNKTSSQLSVKIQEAKTKLIDELNSFSLDNTGFSNFETQIGNTTVKFDDLIDRVRNFKFTFKDIINGTNDFNNLRQQIENFKNAFTDSLKVDNIKKNIDVNGDTTTKIANLESQLRKLGLTETEVANNMDGVNSALSSLNTSIGKNDAQKIISDYDKLIDELKQAQNAYKTLRSDASLFYTQQQQANLSNKIQKWLSDNTRATKEARAEMQGYLDEVSNGSLLKTRGSEINTRISEITSEMRSAGKLGKSWTDTFQSGMKAFSSWTSSTFIVMKTISSIKSAVSTVTELDTALIDLRKTTTMTDSELDQFYYSANNTAKQMGVTTQEIIEQASAWSRLGLVK